MPITTNSPTIAKATLTLSGSSAGEAAAGAGAAAAGGAAAHAFCRALLLGGGGGGFGVHHVVDELLDLAKRRPTPHITNK